MKNSLSNLYTIVQNFSSKLLESNIMNGTLDGAIKGVTIGTAVGLFDVGISYIPYGANKYLDKLYIFTSQFNYAIHVQLPYLNIAFTTDEGNTLYRSIALSSNNIPHAINTDFSNIHNCYTHSMHVLKMGLYSTGAGAILGCLYASGKELTHYLINMDETIENSIDSTYTYN